MAIYFRLFFISCLVYGLRAEETQYRVTVHQMGQCPNDKHAVTFFRNFTLQRTAETSFLLSGLVEITEELQHPIKVAVSVDRANDRSKPVLHYTDIGIDTICDELPKKDQIWSDFVDNIGIRKKCPIHKGHFPLKNFDVTLDMLQPFAAAESYFELKINAKHGKAGHHLCCMMIKATIEPTGSPMGVPANKIGKKFG